MHFSIPYYHLLTVVSVCLALLNPCQLTLFQLINRRIKINILVIRYQWPLLCKQNSCMTCKQMACVNEFVAALISIINSYRCMPCSKIITTTHSEYLVLQYSNIAMKMYQQIIPITAEVVNHAMLTPIAKVIVCNRNSTACDYTGQHVQPYLYKQFYLT